MATGNSSYQYFENTTSTNSYRYYLINTLTRRNGYTNYMTIHEITAFECTDCNISTSTATSTTIQSNFMSPELDQLLIYILEGLIVIGVAYGTYKILK